MAAGATVCVGAPLAEKSDGHGGWVVDELSTAQYAGVIDEFNDRG